MDAKEEKGYCKGNFLSSFVPPPQRLKKNIEKTEMEDILKEEFGQTDLLENPQFNVYDFINKKFPNRTFFAVIKTSVH